MKSVKALNMGRLVIVAYRLPYKFIKKEDSLKTVQNAGGLVSAILSLSEKKSFLNAKNKNNRILWAGKHDHHLEKNEITTHNDFDLYPLYIPDNIDNKYYGGFCNDMIWPLFHYFPDITVFDNSYFDAYVKANQLISEQLKKVIKPGDFIWVHDYHLFLLPAMIRRWAPQASIGFFLHIPFPSFEILRIMPRKWREEIIKGLLGADLVGFHTNDYVQHFINSTNRTLGYECRNNIISTNKRSVKADAFPIGIDFEKFHSSTQLAPVVKEKERLNKTLINIKLIFSVDRLDYSKGLLDRLNAFEFFLEKYPHWRGIVVFNMVVVPSRDTIEHYKQMKKEIEATVGRINGKYSTLNWRPIIYQYKSLHFWELVALYEVSDIGLITPLRDGMNLVSKEFIACQHNRNGVLILSEMAGASAELKEAIIINPHDIREFASAINIALCMKDKEKKVKIEKMQHRIKSYDVYTWAHDFFSQLIESKAEQDIINTKLINENNLIEFQESLWSSKNRIFIFDYDGSLVPYSNDPDKALLNRKMFSLLRTLSNDIKNNIYIISGRDKDFLEKQFKNLNINLIAEHGFYTREFNKGWIRNIELNLGWKNEIFDLLDKYVKRCNGSHIEEKYSSIAWHYRNADLEYARVRLVELKKELRSFFTSHKDLTLLEGNKVLEIKSNKYNKGTAVKDLLSKKNYDFIVAIGDDKTDEFIFEILPETAISVKIGRAPTLAKYYISNQKYTLDFLKLFIAKE